MSRFGLGSIDENSAISLYEFIHGRSVGGDYGGSAAHRLDDVVSPAFGEGRAEMDGMLINEFDDVLVAQVVRDEIYVFWDFIGSIILVLEKGESGPLRVFFPKLEDGFRPLQRAAARKVKDGVFLPDDRSVAEVSRGKAEKFAGRVNFSKDLKCVLTLAEDVVDLPEAWDMSAGEPFLIRDHEVEACGAKPTREDSLEEDVRVESRFSREPIRVKGNLPAVTHRDFEAGSGCGSVDEVDIAIQTHSVSSSDDVQVKLIHDALFSGRCFFRRSSQKPG